MTATDAPAELARTYLAAFLSPDRSDALARRALDAAGRDADAVEVLSVSHQLLVSEVRLADPVAIDVLIEDVGLSPSQVAAVLAIDEDQVGEAVAEARAIADELAVEPTTGAARPEQEVEPEPGSEPAPEPVTYVFDTEEADPGEPNTVPFEESRAPARMRTLTLIVGTVIAAAIAVALLYQGGTEPEEGPVAASTVTVTSARTALPAEDGGPGQTQATFTAGDAVVFWFEYEPLDGDARVELLLSRNGQELINPAFPLPARRTDTHVTLPRAVTEEPGTYSVRLVRDERTLTELSFEVVSQ